MSEDLVYGASPFGYLTVVPRAAVEEATRGIRAALDATTYGEARAADAPLDDDLADDAPYDVRALGLVADGDWPPNAGMLALETLPPEAVAVLAPERSMVGQEWVEFSTDEEARVVAALRQLGHRVERDDDVITAFDTILED